MRQIKFRGKNNGLWWYAEYKPDGDMGEWEQFWALVDGTTVGQFTGLYDRSGKEIYDGDILGAPGKPRTFYQIVWDDANGAWAGKSLWAGRFLLSEDPIGTRDIVIGNIYEHPDLLAKEK